MTQNPIQAVSPSVLILYSSVDGHTRNICERLQTRFVDAGAQVCLREIADQAGSELLGYDLVIIGASIRYGFHRRAVRDFMRVWRSSLQAKPHAFFSVNLVARKPAKAQPETNPYLQHFLRSIGWVTQYLDVFAGRLDYPRCTMLDRSMIRLIMWMTGGPTRPDTVIEYTDWQRVEAFGKRLLAALPAKEQAD